MKKYLDADGLFGASAPPSAHWSGGNELLESVTALAIAKRLGVLDTTDVTSLVAATRHCEAGGPGIYDKNPPVDGKRRADQITHDDMLAVSCGSKILGMPFAGEIRNWGSTHGQHGVWILSNTGEVYPESIVRPFHKAVYLSNAGYRVDRVSLVALRGYMDVMPDAPGEHRLRWLIAESIAGADSHVDRAIGRWRKLIAASGGMKEVFRQYHGDNHVFTRFCTFSS